MNPRGLPLVCVLAAFGFGAGCKFPTSGTVYDRAHVGRSMSVEAGDIVAVREVQVSGRTTIIGVGGGGLVGGAAASGGAGVGGAIAAAGGAVVGAIAGEALEEVATRKRAQEITVKLTTGDTVAVVQEVGNDGSFAVGQHVQILQGGSGATVRRLY